MFILFIVDGNGILHILHTPDTTRGCILSHTIQLTDVVCVRNGRVFSLDFPTAAVIWPPVVCQSTRTSLFGSIAFQISESKSPASQIIFKSIKIPSMSVQESVLWIVQIPLEKTKCFYSVLANDVCEFLVENSWRENIDWHFASDIRNQRPPHDVPKSKFQIQKQWQHQRPIR